jgi:hypothetical protein
MGRLALANNTIGHHNIAQGYRALGNNTTGSRNIAIGECAATLNSTGYHNIAVGGRSLYGSTSGYGNVAFGQCALHNNATGCQNTAIGYNAGLQNRGGSNNTFVGNGASGIAAACSNTITLGNGYITTIRAQVTSITALSDARDKKDIVDIPLGLEFLRQVHPVKFTWNMRDGSKVGQGYAGFIAQELKQLVDSYAVKDWMELVISNEDESRYEAAPGKLLPIIVKAIQELAQKLDDHIAKGH